VVFEHVALQGNANNFPFRYSKGSYAYNETETHFIRLGILGQEYGFVELLVLGFWRERSLRLGTYGFFLSAKTSVAIVLGNALAPRSDDHFPGILGHLLGTGASSTRSRRHCDVFLDVLHLVTPIVFILLRKLS